MSSFAQSSLCVRRREPVGDRRSPMTTDPDQHGLEQAFITHRATLGRYLRARRAGADADDILQELWIKVRDADHSHIREPLPYLYRMAENHLLSAHREGGRRLRRETLWGENRVEVNMPADEILAAQQELREVDSVLATLGERTRSILYRYRVDGWSQKEIAQDLGVSLSLVEKHLQRAYRALAALRQERAGRPAAPERLRDD